ncbi:MAG: flavin reductase family protein [Candidatus Binatia bacterium]
MLKKIALPQAYRVTPTGLYLISTAYQGKRNVQFAFRALGISDEPPLLLIGIQNKNFSHAMIEKSGEFVINVCSEKQLHAVDRSRNMSGRNVEDKFIALGLEPVPATCVQAPLVAGCHANVECKVVQQCAVDELILFVGQALAAHLDDEIAPIGRLAGKTFRFDDPI